MKWRMTLLLAMLGALMVSAVSATAITNGDLDGEAHPYVGLMVAQDAAGEPLWRCSGTLIAPKVFLTAGHCTEAPAEHVEIWFASDVQSGIPANGYPFNGDVGGKPYVHPDYDPAAFFRADLGVVVLEKKVTGRGFGVLPKLDQLDALNVRNTTTFTAVGYGRQLISPAPGIAERVRMVASPHLLQINTGFTGDFSLLLSNNHSTGGTCFGDSGGPNFLGTSNVVAGVTSFGLNSQCGGTGGVYRVDRKDDLNWLSGTFGRLLR
jgi:Trypsin